VTAGRLHADPRHSQTDRADLAVIGRRRGLAVAVEEEGRRKKEEDANATNETLSRDALARATARLAKKRRSYLVMVSLVSLLGLRAASGSSAAILRFPRKLDREPRREPFLRDDRR